MRSRSAHDPAVAEPHGKDDRLARLGRAVVDLARELADSRREVMKLKRENAALRARLADIEQVGGTG